MHSKIYSQHINSLLFIVYVFQGLARSSELYGLLTGKLTNAEKQKK